MRNIKHLVLSFVTGLGFVQTGLAAELATELVSPRETPVEQVLDATIEAVKQSTISAEISGRITEIHFDVDDTVQKGAVLIKVRDNEYRARLRQAEASLNEAKARYEDAKLEYRRSQDMFKKNVISESQFDRAAAALKAAEARVAASKAALAEAREQLANTVIRAPYSGVVTARHVEIGETVNPGKPLMTGFSLDELRAVVDVPQSFINAIRKHESARIIARETGKSINSTSLTIFPFADPASHAFKVRAYLPKSQRHLYPGMLVKAAFLIDTTKRLMVPAGAVVHRSEVNAVYVVDENGKVRMRQVRLGYHNQDRIEILAGLTAGEAIALDPVAAGIALKTQAGE